MFPSPTVDGPPVSTNALGLYNIHDAPQPCTVDQVRELEPATSDGPMVFQKPVGVTGRHFLSADPSEPAPGIVQNGVTRTDGKPCYPYRDYGLQHPDRTAYYTERLSPLAEIDMKQLVEPPTSKPVDSGKHAPSDRWKFYSEDSNHRSKRARYD